MVPTLFYNNIYMGLIILVIQVILNMDSKVKKKSSQESKHTKM
jgi:hypothetical protein